MADKTISQQRTLKTAYRKKYPMNLEDRDIRKIHHKTSEDSSEWKFGIIKASNKERKLRKTTRPLYVTLYIQERKTRRKHLENVPFSR